MEEKVAFIKGFLDGVASVNTSFYVGFYNFSCTLLPQKASLQESIHSYLITHHTKKEIFDLEEISIPSLYNILAEWFVAGFTKQKFDPTTSSDHGKYIVADFLERLIENFGKSIDFFRVKGGKILIHPNSQMPIADEIFLTVNGHAFALYLSWSD